MSRKPNVTGSEPVVSEEILRTAKMALESERPQPSVRCVICGGDAAPTSAETLCWVCRRLKISAWRDVDSQVPVQE